MTLPRTLKTYCAVFLAVLLTNIPHLVFSETLKNSTGSMIPTSVVVEELTRAQALANVDEFLKHSEVKKQLMANGLSEKEVQLRVASLSETELRQLSHQMDEARAGGDILIAILVVVLIIFLIKRI